MMARKKDNKAIFIVVIILAIVVVAIYLVWSGTLWSILGIEPLFAPFEASVTISNSPPAFITILPTRDVTNANVQIAGSADGQVDIQVGTTDYAVVKFVVEDPNVPTLPNDLSNTPTVIAYGSPTAANNEIAVRLTSPQLGVRCTGPGCRTRDATTANRPTGVATTCTAVMCAADADCAAKGYTAPENAKRKAYTCYVQMQYFDEPVTATPPTAGNQMWTISLYIEDNTGNANQVTPSTSADFAGVWGAGDELYYVLVRPSTDVDISPSTEKIQWTGLSVVAVDNPGDDGNAVDSGTGLTLRNIGNKVVTSIDITPQNLLGVVNPVAVLSATAFSVGLALGAANAGACDVAAGGGSPTFDGTALTGGATLANFLRNIPFTADTPAQGLPAPATSAMQDLFFCIWPSIQTGTYLSGGSDTSYRATGGVFPYTAGQFWEIVLNS